ncbi:hypothetical protein [Deinococcus aestuarii]|nr:hypothetical protein [Deinococcus aestuarii]
MTWVVPGTARAVTVSNSAGVLRKKARLLIALPGWKSPCAS